MKPKHTLAILATLMGSLMAAAPATAQEIQWREAWMPAYSVEMTNTPLFATLVNLSQRNDRLIAVRSDQAEQVSIRALQQVDGTLREVVLDSLELPAGVPITLGSDTAWLLLENTRTPVRARSTHTVTLVFEHAGEVSRRVRATPVRFPAERVEDIHSDPLQRPVTAPRSEGLDDALRSDPFLR
ncbi:copper chaperone PCu(A)C [Azoarcus taiwanensis]|uniref:Copper chaperone PCu(A)C n=1 Tax=Azoarcus taiwanensis TaxID=666964 RepID=A0A972J989_9RHOO|nr:copper chaperone PCu(A)C [Azoarcus taiwanensis]NMG02680.1 copper chaperone PCu(A)C [Azoarcus taiwanensis]